MTVMFAADWAQCSTVYGYRGLRLLDNTIIGQWHLLLCHVIVMVAADWSQCVYGYRALRLLLREITRCLRHDLNIPAFCSNLMMDRMKDKFEVFKVNLSLGLCMCLFLSVSLLCLCMCLSLCLSLCVSLSP